MRYKLASPKGLPDSAGLAQLKARVDAARSGHAEGPGLEGEVIAADLLALGTAYHFRGMDGAAVEVLEDLLARRNEPRAFQYLAVSYERLCRYQEAVGTHRRALECWPGQAFHLGHLGRLLCLMGRDEDAMKALKAARKAAPFDAHVRARLASVRSRVRPDDLDDTDRRPTYGVIVLLGDRANLGTYQTLLESLYRRLHRLVLVVADTGEPGDTAGGDGGIAVKAWMKRHPGVQLASHAPARHRRPDRTRGWLHRSAAGDELGGWIRRQDADLMLVCLDRTAPSFVEPYIRAADAIGHLLCGLSTSGEPTPLDWQLGRAVPRLRCVAGDAAAAGELVSVAGNALVVQGDPALERFYRPRPDKSERQLFDQLFPALAAGTFVLYLADPAREPLDELMRAGSLASRLRQSERLDLRRLRVVYRSAMPARFPGRYPLPDNLVIWPRPEASQDTNTAAMLRVGIHRAFAVLSPAAGTVVPAALAGRPAIALATGGEPARAETPCGGAMYRCGSLGEAVYLLGQIADGCDPAAAARATLAERGGPDRLGRFDSIGAVLARAVELLAGGEAPERLAIRLTGEIGDSAPAGSEAMPGADAGSALLRWLQGHGVAGPASGPAAGGLIAQLLGGAGDAETRLQSALLVKAAHPDLSVCLVDFEDRFEQTERALRAAFPQARIANAVSDPPQAGIRSFDFVYALADRLRELVPDPPAAAFAQPDLCLLPAQQVAGMAACLAGWPVRFLGLAIAAGVPGEERQAATLRALRRWFRLSDPAELPGGRHRLVAAVSRPEAIRQLSGDTAAVELPRALRRPGVSIGLVVYNGAAGLPEALDSILAQTHWDFEVIVVDNGSTDATLEIARSYADRDPRVILYPRRKNVGAVGNFRLALSLATSEYFCWASDHDVYDRVWLERMLAALEERPDAVLAYPYFGMIDDRGARIGDHLVRFDTAGRNIACRMRMVTGRMRGSGSKVYGLYRRAALDRVRVRTTVWWDRLFLQELAAVGAFVQVPEVLWWRRYKGILRDRIPAPEAGKFGAIPPGLSTRETVVRQLAISFEDGRPPFLMRPATLANAVLFLVDLVLAPPGRRGMDLRMLPLAVRNAVDAVVRTRAFVPAEFRALWQHLTGR